jgi:hypothetical protein
VKRRVDASATPRTVPSLRRPSVVTTLRGSYASRPNTAPEPGLVRRRTEAAPPLDRRRTADCSASRGSRPQRKRQSQAAQRGASGPAQHEYEIDDGRRRGGLRPNWPTSSGVACTSGRPPPPSNTITTCHPSPWRTGGTTSPRARDRDTYEARRRNRPEPPGRGVRDPHARTARLAGPRPRDPSRHSHRLPAPRSCGEPAPRSPRSRRSLSPVPRRVRKT